MNFDEKDIKIARVIIKKLCNPDELSPVDSDKLEKWITSSEQNRQLFERFKVKIPVEDYQKITALTDENRHLMRLMDTVKGSSTFGLAGRRRRWLGYAAGILVLITGLSLAFYLSRQSEKQTPLALNRIVPGQPKVIFELPTGEEIFIDHMIPSTKIEKDGFDLIVDSLNGRVQYIPKENSPQNSPALNRLRVPKGGEYSLELPDGTVVWMNSESSLQFPETFSSEKREVYLEGEACFHVATNAEWPFYVHTQQCDIRVLGTTFNVSAYRDDRVWHTTLVEGSVAIGRGGDETLLKPNEQYRIDVINGSCEVKKVDPELYTSWVEGKFYFKAYVFEELVTKLERWYDFKMSYADEEIKKRRFSGVVNKYQPLQEMLKFLEMTSNVKFKIEKNEVRASLDTNKEN